MAVTSGLIPSTTTILSFICHMCLRGKLPQLIRWRAMHNSVSTLNTLRGWDNPLPVTGGPIQSAPASLHKFSNVAFFRFRRWRFPPPLAASLLSFTRYYNSWLSRSPSTQTYHDITVICSQDYITGLWAVWLLAKCFSMPL
jgi:hypothetical protein